MKRTLGGVATLVGLIAATAAASSCASGTPPGATVGEKCFRCGRAILDTRLAAAIVNAEGALMRFRTPGCLAQFAVKNSRPRQALYVTDHPTGEMIRVTGAVFVPFTLVEANGIHGDLVRDERALLGTSPEIEPAPGQGDYLAFRSASAAAEAAATHQTAPVEWPAVLTAASSATTMSSVLAR